MRTCELEVPAGPVPLFLICQLTNNDPPAVTLLLPGVTFSGCTSTVVATAVTVKVDDNPEFLLAGDFDSVGTEDLVLMHGKSNFVAYLKGTGSLPTPGYTKNLVTVSRDPFAAVAGDVTGSTALDVVVASREHRAVTILAGNGSGSFSRTQIGFTATTTFPIVVPTTPTNLNFSCSPDKSDLLFLQPLSDRVVILNNKNNCL